MPEHFHVNDTTFSNTARGLCMFAAREKDDKKKYLVNGKIRFYFHKNRSVQLSSPFLFCSFFHSFAVSTFFTVFAADAAVCILTHRQRAVVVTIDFCGIFPIRHRHSQRLQFCLLTKPMNTQYHRHRSSSFFDFHLVYH